MCLREEKKKLNQKTSLAGTNPFLLKDVWKQSLKGGLKGTDVNSAGYCKSLFI